MFTQLTHLNLDSTVKLILRDGETVAVNFCRHRNILFGMRKLVRLYSIEATDVMVFTFIRDSIFVLSIFKFDGMESKYTAVEVSKSEAMNNVRIEDIIVLSDSDQDEDGESNLELISNYYKCFSF